MLGPGLARCTGTSAPAASAAAPVVQKPLMQMLKEEAERKPLFAVVHLGLTTLLAGQSHLAASGNMIEIMLRNIFIVF